MRNVLSTTIKIILLIILSMAIGLSFLSFIAWCISPNIMGLAISGIVEDGEPIGRYDYIRQFELRWNIDLPDDMRLAYMPETESSFGSYRLYLCIGDPLEKLDGVKSDKNSNVENEINYILNWIDKANPSETEYIPTLDCNYQYVALAKYFNRAYLLYFPEMLKLYIIENI